MKTNLYLVAVVLLLALTASAQKLSKPKQMPNPETAAQRATIQQGIELHDAKKYDEAIAKYLAVLEENPDSTLAMYELSMSYYSKGDKVKAKEMAFRGAKYISDDLALFYGTIANILDDEGRPEEAIKLYRDAEDILKSYPGFQKQLASIYYNLGITYFRLKKYTESRTELKKAVENNFAYGSPHYLLAVVYNGTKYKIPAFLAAARLISLDSNSQRTTNAVTILTEILKPASKNPATGNIDIFMNLDAPKDEGDFTIFDLLLGTLTVVRGDEDKNKTDDEMFIDAIGSVVEILAEDKKMRSTFVGKTYVPFMSEMKQKGHLEAFGYLILSKNGNGNASKWVKSNDAKVASLLKWAKEYQAPGK